MSPLPPHVRQRLKQQYRNLNVLTAQKRKNHGQLCPNWNPVSQTWLPGYTGFRERMPIHINDISTQYARNIIRYITRKSYLPIPELVAIANITGHDEQLNIYTAPRELPPF